MAGHWCSIPLAGKQPRNFSDFADWLGLTALPNPKH